MISSPMPVTSTASCPQLLRSRGAAGPRRRRAVSCRPSPSRRPRPSADHGRRGRRPRSRRAGPASGRAPAVRTRVRAHGDEVGGRTDAMRRSGQPRLRACRVSASSSSAGVNRPALPGAQPLVRLQRARLLERVDDGVLSLPRRQRAPGVGQRAGRADAVGQVALGRRAEARARCRCAPSSAMSSSVQVGGVHRGGPRAERAGLVRAARSACGRRRRGTPRSRPAARRGGRAAAGPGAPGRDRRQVARAARPAPSGSRRRRAQSSVVGRRSVATARAPRPSTSPSANRRCALGCSGVPMPPAR